MTKLFRHISLILTLAFQLAVLSSPAQALDPGFQDGFGGFIGSCSVTMNHGDGIGNGTAIVINGSVLPGGSRYDHATNSVITGPALTAAYIEANCGLTNVTNFVSDGISAPFESDARYGFSFTADNGALGIQDFEFFYTGASPTLRISRISGTGLVRPNVSVSQAPATHDGVTPFTVTAAFSEDVSGFTAGDLSAFGSSFGANFAVSGGPRVYTITAHPTGAGTVRVQVPVGSAVNALNNINEQSNTIDILYAADTTAPTVTLSGAPSSFTSTAPFDVTAAFAEDVVGFEAADVTVSNASVSVSEGPASYTITVTPDGTGDVTISLGAAVAQDAAGNDNTASNQLTIVNAIDAEAPTVELSGAPASFSSTSPFDVAAMFSEPVTGFDASDVVVSNATVTVSTMAGYTDQTAYTITVTPSGTGDVTLSLAAAAAQDASGNGNIASNQVTIVNAIDATAPSVMLSGAPVEFTSTAPFDVTATFSEDVTGFEAGDVTVTNATVALSGGPAAYVITVTPDGTGDVVLSVGAAAARDAAGNDSAASNELNIRNNIDANSDVTRTQEAIQGFMLQRANALASNQPGLIRFLDNGRCGSFNATANDNSGKLHGCASRGGVWVEVTGSWMDSGSYALATIGAHQWLSPNVIVGGMLQFDNAKFDQNNASGTGWMVGPYFAAKAPSQPLFFEGRLLYGQTDNTITPTGLQATDYETERWLAQFRMTGEVVQDQLTWKPFADVTYTEDRQKTFVNSTGLTIPSQSVSLMQASLGLDFSMPINVQTGDAELTGGLSIIHSETNGSLNTSSTQDFSGTRGRFHVGFAQDMGEAGSLRIGAFYDGIGSSFDSYGGSLGWEMRF